MIDNKTYLETLKKDYSGWDNRYKFVIDNLKNNIAFGYARFNDGEMMGIDRVGSVAARGDQVVNEGLHKALITALQHAQPKYYVGVPCSVCYPHYEKLASDLLIDDNYKVSAVALTNRNWAKFISELPEAIKDRKVKMVTGDDQDFRFLENELSFNIDSVYRFKAKDSWSEIDNIRPIIKEVKDGDVVFISLGPTARVLTQEWFKEKPNSTFIDIGSVLDPFTRSVYHNCHKGWENGFNLTRRCNTCN